LSKSTRRYSGSTLEEAVQAAFDELGRDADITDARRVRRGGVFGVLAKQQYVVTARHGHRPRRTSRYERHPVAEPDGTVTMAPVIRRNATASPVEPPSFGDQLERLVAQVEAREELSTQLRLPAPPDEAPRPSFRPDDRALADVLARAMAFGETPAPRVAAPTSRRAPLPRFFSDDDLAPLPAEPEEIALPAVATPPWELAREAAADVLPQLAMPLNRQRKQGTGPRADQPSLAVITPVAPTAWRTVTKDGQEVAPVVVAPTPVDDEHDEHDEHDEPVAAVERARTPNPRPTIDLREPARPRGRVRRAEPAAPEDETIDLRELAPRPRRERAERRPTPPLDGDVIDLRRDDRRPGPDATTGGERPRRRRADDDRPRREPADPVRRARARVATREERPAAAEARPARRRPAPRKERPADDHVHVVNWSVPALQALGVPQQIIDLVGRPDSDLAWTVSLERAIRIALQDRRHARTGVAVYAKGKRSVPRLLHGMLAGDRVAELRIRGRLVEPTPFELALAVRSCLRR
jgi:hypothetical protein